MIKEEKFSFLEKFSKPKGTGKFRDFLFSYVVDVPLNILMIILNWFLNYFRVDSILMPPDTKLNFLFF